MKYYDTIILGGGAAAYAAAIYAARYNMQTLVIEEEFGGETATAGPIENYPGFKSIDGFELMTKMQEQAKDSGVEMVSGKAELVRNVHHCFQVRVGKELYEGKTLILAVGMERRKLGLPREDELKGKGIHYCPTCDGPVYKDKIVAIVGGGDAAVKGANQLADVAKHVFLIVREDTIDRAEPVNRDQFKKRKNTTILFRTEVKEFIGENRVEQVKLSKPYDGADFLKLHGLFVEIGAIPRSTIPAELGVNLDARGQIMVDRMMKTSIDGIFAAGDITDGAAGFKQIVTAAAQGSLAATAAYHDLAKHDTVCALHAVPTAATPRTMTKKKA